jgi:hypothetical protein
MRMGDTVIILSKFITEHLPEGVTLVSMSKESDKFPWLASADIEITGKRMGQTGNVQIAIGKVHAQTIAPPLIGAEENGEGIILPQKLMNWLLNRLEKSQQGAIAGRVVIGVRWSPKSPTQYAWTGDFQETAIEATQQTGGKVPF